MYNTYGLFIANEWRNSSDKQTSPVRSPATEEVIGEVPVATKADSEEAIAAAASGFDEWRKRTCFDRADSLHAITDEMIRRSEDAAVMISSETGKPIGQARREWVLAIDQFRWYAEEARRVHGRIIESRAPGGRLEVLYEPVGIAAAFTAWNFPAVLVARKVAPALAAGCAAIVRPSRQTPGSAMILFECIRAGNLPRGTVSLLTGPTDQTYVPLMASRSVRKVSLTGSIRVGQKMIRDAAETMKKVSMELGGNAPLIVFDDADLDSALDIAVKTKYANAGQVCVTPDRFYVHESLYDRFVEGFASRAKTLRVGDGLDETTDVGPLVSAKRRDEIEAVVADAAADGARVAAGGTRSDTKRGHFFEPTVLTEVPDDARAMSEENFGPVAPITPFSDVRDVYTRANSSPAGLSAYAFTGSAARAREVVAELKAGMVGVNSFALAAAEAPFGGTNFSGMGREGGREGIIEYLEVKLAQMTI